VFGRRREQVANSSSVVVFRVQATMDGFAQAARGAPALHAIAAGSDVVRMALRARGARLRHGSLMPRFRRRALTR
jgi:hypothetical protein